MTTDEQRARKLAEQIFRSYDIQTRPKSIIADIANLLLPLIRDQARLDAVDRLRINLWTEGDGGHRWYSWETHDHTQDGNAPDVRAAIDKARGET